MYKYKYKQKQYFNSKTTRQDHSAMEQSAKDAGIKEI